MNFRKASYLANQILEQLAPACERIAIAGSVRRRKTEVKDIEIVAIPRVSPVKNLFGETMYDHSHLEQIVYQLGTVVKGGEKYKQIRIDGSYLKYGESINLDLFLVTPPAQFGVIYVLRTGPDSFSTWMVTKRSQGGALPSYARSRQGAIWEGNQIVPMPEEQDFFSYCGLEWIEPAGREPKWKGEWKS